MPRYNLTRDDFPNLSYPLVTFLDPKNQLYSPKAIDRHRKDHYYENGTLIIQQQLPHNWLLQAGYTGAEDLHLFDRYTDSCVVDIHRATSDYNTFDSKNQTADSTIKSSEETEKQSVFFK